MGERARGRHRVEVRPEHKAEQRRFAALVFDELANSSAKNPRAWSPDATASAAEAKGVMFERVRGTKLRRSAHLRRIEPPR